MITKNIYPSFLAFLMVPLLLEGQTLEWATSVGGSQFERATYVKVDKDKSVYTVGQYSSTNVDFDPGVGTHVLSATNGYDYFIQKLDSAGQFLWAKSIGGNGSQCGNSIAIDSIGNLYVSGYFQQAVDFDPGPGIAVRTAKGQVDLFVQKLDAMGNFQWVKTFGGPNAQIGNSNIDMDMAGNLYLTGRLWGTADFDPDIGVFQLSSSGDSDAFMLKLNYSGNLIWARSIGSNQVDGGTFIKTDISGNIYLSGYFSGTVDFDPGPSAIFNSSNGEADIFLSKWDASGNLIWVNHVGGPGLDLGSSISLDLQNDAIYFTGYFKDTVDFDPGIGIQEKTSRGDWDIFVQKLDTSGSMIWTYSIGGKEWDSGHFIELDESNQIYVTGLFKDTVDFDPGSGIKQLISFGNADVFLLKIDSAGNYLWAGAMGGSEFDAAYGLDVGPSGGIYTAGGFRQIADFDPDSNVVFLSSQGESDIFLQKFSQCTDTEYTDTVAVCLGDSYTFPDGFQVLAVEDIISHTSSLESFTGCDSVIHTTLTINPTYDRVKGEILCRGDSYTFPDGSIATNIQSAVSQISFLQTSAGCDSSIQTNIELFIVDTTVVQINHLSLQATADSASFQWVDCNNGYAIIAGATDSVFSATENGSYAVIVSQHNCSDTSACFPISSVRLLDKGPLANVQVHPNPFQNQLRIEFGNPITIGTIYLIDSQGQTIDKIEINNQQQILWELPNNLSQQLYLLKIKTGKYELSVKLIKL